jgi:hypothetical protein
VAVLFAAITTACVLQALVLLHLINELARLRSRP